MTAAKIYFPARYKGAFEKVKARMNFAALIAARGEGVAASVLIGDANWTALKVGDRIPVLWGDGTVGRLDAGAVKVGAPYIPFLVETVGLNAPGGYVDLVITGGEMGRTYLVSTGIRLTNGEELIRSAAISIAQL